MRALRRKLTLGVCALAAAAAGNLSCAGLGDVAGDIVYAATGDQKAADIARGAGTAFESFGGIPFEEERAIGGAVAVQVVSRYGGEYRNRALTKYVNVLGTAIAQSSDRPGIPYHFMVLDQDTPNAFAAPGGYVFVTTGMLRSARNEAELAGVLGHEIAHVTEGHTLDVLRRSKFFQGAAQAGAAALDKDPEIFAGLVNEATQLLFDKGLDQSMEFDADRLGTDFAARLGYRPAGLRDFVATLGANSRYSRSALFKTHPSPGARVGRLDRVLSGYRSGYGAATVQDRFRAAKRAAGLASAGPAPHGNLAHVHDWCALAPKS